MSTYIDRVYDPARTSSRWENYQLPSDMNGMTFLDVGCWTGEFCVEAMKRGAKKALGIDMVKGETLSKLQQQYSFEFLLGDIFSEKFWEIPSFDIVFSAGVLYHVENPISLLFRLKSKTLKKLVLGTIILTDKKYEDLPILQLLPENNRDGNYSNWWIPNKLFVEKALSACEFDNIKKVYEEGRRVCFHATPKNSLCKKIRPRKEEYM